MNLRKFLLTSPNREQKKFQILWNYTTEADELFATSALQISYLKGVPFL